MNTTIPSYDDHPEHEGPIDQAPAYIDGERERAADPAYVGTPWMPRVETGDTMTVRVRPIAPGREHRAMVTIEVAERLANIAYNKLDSDTPLLQNPLITEVRGWLETLINVTTVRTCTEVKSLADSDAISGEATKEVRAIRARLNAIADAQPALPQLVFSWVPDGFQVSIPEAYDGHQASVETPAGRAVITAIADGGCEIETKFPRNGIRTYLDTLSPDAAMARLAGLVAAHIARRDS